MVEAWKSSKWFRLIRKHEAWLKMAVKCSFLFFSLTEWGALNPPNLCQSVMGAYVWKHKEQVMHGRQGSVLTGEKSVAQGRKMEIKHMTNVSLSSLHFFLLLHLQPLQSLCITSLFTSFIVLQNPHKPLFVTLTALFPFTTGSFSDSSQSQIFH